MKLTEKSIDRLLEAASRVERDRAYVAVQGLHDATSQRTSHGKAQRIAYKRAMNAIYPGGKRVEYICASDMSGPVRFGTIVSGQSCVSAPGTPLFGQPSYSAKGPEL